MADEEPIFKRVLNKCRHTLVEDLDFESICDYLISKEVFQTIKVRDLREEKYTSEKNRKLIEAVAAGGVNTFKHFLRGLKSTQQGHLYEFLMKEETELQEKAKKKTKNLTSEADQLHARMDTVQDVSTNAMSLTKVIKTPTGASEREETDDERCDLLQNSSKTTASTRVPSTSQLTSKDVVDSASLHTLTSGAGALFEPQSTATPNFLPSSSSSSQITPEMVGSNNDIHGPKYLPDTGNNAFSRSQAQQSLNNIQGRNGEQPISFGNYSSYKDMYEKSPTLSETSGNGQTGINLNGTTETVNNPHNTTGQKQDQLQHQNTSGPDSHSIMGGVRATDRAADQLCARMDYSILETLPDVFKNAMSLTKVVKPSREASGIGETDDVRRDSLQNSSKTTATLPVPTTSQITSKNVVNSQPLHTLTSGACAPFEPQSTPTPNYLPSSSSSSQITAMVGLNDVADGPTYVSADARNYALSRQQAEQGQDNLQGWSEEQPISFGNISSYKDMHEKSSTYSETSGKDHSGITPNDVSETVNNSHKTPGPRQEQIQQNTNGSGSNSAMKGVAATDQAGGLPALPVVSAEQTSAAPGAPSGKTAATVTELGGNLTTTDTNDGHIYLKKHFDMCVLYTEGNRNRADEIVQFIENCPGNFTVCCYDDEEYFGLFTPESLASVIIQHCVLLLIVIAENLEEDKYAKYVRSTFGMYQKNSAKIRPVLFTKAEDRFIPKSLANSRPIAWYDKDKDHFRRNILALLNQCRDFRKTKEQSVWTRKDMEH